MFLTSDIIRLMTYTLDIRQRRQVTLPRELLLKWGVDEGDKLRIEVKDGNTATMVPQKKVALEALEEIQAIFAKSGTAEEEFARHAS